jgi:hypothetical protein
MKHAPNRRLIQEARLFFMDMACCILGFLCHPMKCPKPSQCVKFIGFEFDSHGFPLLRVPLEKRERALAVVEYLIASPPGQFFSRLSLAVSTGILQSLVEATPSHIGSTYLRAHYDLLITPLGVVWALLRTVPKQSFLNLMYVLNSAGGLPSCAQPVGVSPA